jgi:2,4-dienoyl-CoA reductase-like NADH-dependent reductase (Old Yellow Enzyme family)
MGDVIREAKRRIGKDFAVTCLYNVAEYNYPKATTFEEGVGFVRYLEAAGAVHDKLQVPGVERRDVKTSGDFHKQMKFYMKFFSPPALEKLTKIWMVDAIYDGDRVGYISL